ncbi:LacI family DNA-binding transcriptional regulator [Clostridium sp.]|uniref:LacI family DNA-binding transcriptional regulator n=1 Tax=Clostridium sp. TaxID=1506 RepID=UPI001A4FE52D|nr:LacI family DNA-binding transcriptional regulator [Clostridium sp.]MBK5237262.1 LacI family DNA-binding transcriptional regulator [Clostridium sp.]
MSDIVTIKDVAKYAGVSTATVTHTLNGKRPVKTSTKKKVLNAIEKLNYVPSWNASKLKSGKSGIIGCLAVDITELFTSRLVKGIESELGNNQYSLLFVSAVEFDGDLIRAYNSLKAHNVDGIILCYHIPSHKSLLKDIDPATPTVCLNMTISGFESIVIDNIAGGEMAAKHLLSCGVKNPAIICGPSHRYSSIDRYEGFINMYKSNGIEIDENHEIYGKYDSDTGFNSTLKLLENDNKIDGFFCENDFIAAGCLNALNSLHIRVPEEVKVIGFDNRDFSSFYNPTITTFEIPLHDMGKLGMKKLKEKIEESEEISVSKIQLTPKLIIRESTQIKQSK